MCESIKQIYEKIREIVIIILLFLWMLIPILKSFKFTMVQAYAHEYTFMLFIGIIGLTIFIIDLINKWKETDNKKEYFKRYLPIFTFCIFMAWTFISCCFSPNTNNAFWGTTYRKDGYITYLIYAAFFGCTFLLKSKTSQKIIINAFVILAIIKIVIVQLYSKGFLNGVIATLRTNAGTFYQFNHYGYYLMLATVSSLFLGITENNRIKKILYFIAAAVIIYNLILNDTFGCVLALIVTLIFFVIYCISNKIIKLRALIIILMTISCVFFVPKVREITEKNIEKLMGDISKIIAVYQSNNDAEKEKLEQLAEKAGTNRIALWKNGIKFFLERPILGYGPENLGVKYAQIDISGEKGQDRPHNLLIQLATTSGIIGLISYVTAIGIILVRGLKKIKLENSIHIISFFVVVSYLISAIFGNSMYYTSPYFFIFLGFLMSENINDVKLERDNCGSVIKAKRKNGIYGIMKKIEEYVIKIFARYMNLKKKYLK